MKNYGVDLSKEVQSPKDWIFGAASAGIVDNITILNLVKHMTKGEPQYKNRLETMSCVPFTGSKSVDTLMNAHIAQGLFSEENIKWLEDNGYIVDGKVNTSDRFVAINSKTTKKGNSGSRVNQAMRDFGMIPEAMLPFTDQDTWDEYHSGITEEMFALGREWKKRFEIQYERVYTHTSSSLENDLETITEALKHSPLMVYVFAWEEPQKGIYQRTNKEINHAVALFDTEYFINDQYINWRVDGGYIKQLAPDFKFLATAYRYAIVQKNIIPKESDMQHLVKGDKESHIYVVSKGGERLHKMNSMPTLQMGVEAGLWQEFDEVKNTRPQAEVDAMPKGSEIGFLI